MSGSGIQDSIDSLMGFDEDAVAGSDATGDADASTEQGSTAAQQADTQTQPTGTRSGNADASTQSGADGSRERPSTAANKAEAPQAPAGRLPANGRGDLVDADGNVVARAGTERRYYEMARDATTRLNGEREARIRAEAQVHAYSQQQTEPQRLGLTPDDTSIALTFAAQWKKNPTAAVQEMLAEYRKMGYEVEGLGGGIDTATVKQIISEQLRPITSEYQQRQQQTQQEREAQTIIDDLHSRLPWSKIPDQWDAIMLVMERDQSLTPREAALTVQTWAHQNGYDLNQPLRPQVTAARYGSPQQQPVAQAPARPANPLRAPAPTADNGLLPARGRVVEHETPTRNIVLESMREAGMQIENL